MDSPNDVHARIPTRYGEARFVLGVLDFFGGMLAIVGLLWFAWALYNLVKLLVTAALDDGGGADGFSLLALLGLAPSLGMLVGGILIFAHSQLIRATLDSADLQRESFLLTEQMTARPPHA